MTNDIVPNGNVFVHHPTSERGGVDMQKERAIVKIRKEHRRLLQLPLGQFNSRHDRLWHQTPKMGAEALIATLDSKRELQKALKKAIMKRKN
jgi:hypothetical protein